jgi:N-hydroxyarylamine O-acetyltransferase
MMTAEESVLVPALRDDVLRRFGFTRPPAPDLDGLRGVYRAWCRNIPFDNLNKMIALRTAAPGLLPDIQATDFFETWLHDGTGGTCWPSANAIYSLLRSLGFDARRVAAHMQDAGFFNHGTVIVRLGGQEWVVDSSVQTDVPMLLDRDGFLNDDPAFFAEIEYETRENEPSTYILWVASPREDSYMPCRIFPVEVPFTYFVERFEATRERSPFNSRLYVGRNREHEKVIVIGNMRHVVSSRGIESRELSRAEFVGVLRADFHLSENVLQRWVAAGGLELAFEEYTGPSFPPQERKPPSRR